MDPMTANRANDAASNWSEIEEPSLLPVEMVILSQPCSECSIHANSPGEVHKVEDGDDRNRDLRESDERSGHCLGQVVSSVPLNPQHSQWS